MKKILLTGLLFFVTHSAYATKIVGNGGDFYALEFIAVAQRVMMYLEITQTTAIDTKKLSGFVNQTDVESTTKALRLKGLPKDAINYPSLKKIIFNRDSWNRADAAQKRVMVLHEYLGVMGIDDIGYRLSKIVLNNSGHDNFDRKLSLQEMKTLLPIYVNFIKARASELPTVEEFDKMNRIARVINDPTHAVWNSKNDNVVGYQLYDIKSLISNLEKETFDLKHLTTPGDREKSLDDLLSGFSRHVRSGKITCLLGYKSELRDKNERIVKCQDNRSRPEKSEDEGVLDIRSFTLSIDDKTLSPIGVVHLAHDFAG